MPHAQCKLHETLVTVVRLFVRTMGMLLAPQIALVAMLAAGDVISTMSTASLPYSSSQQALTW